MYAAVLRSMFVQAISHPSVAKEAEEEKNSHLKGIRVKMQGDLKKCANISFCWLYMVVVSVFMQQKYFSASSCSFSGDSYVVAFFFVDERLKNVGP